MHKSALKYGEFFFSTYFNSDDTYQLRIIEIGSQDINGSLRQFSPANAIYFGVDFVSGPGVDVLIADPYHLPFESDSVDSVICSSVFEHSEFFWMLFLECLRILKPNGLMYINAPSNGKVHRYPIDGWRFYPDAGHALVKWAKSEGKTALLLESFIAPKLGPIEEEGMWNDFVAVFLKNEKYSTIYKNRILDNEPAALCGYSYGQNIPILIEELHPDNVELNRQKIQINDFEWKLNNLLSEHKLLNNKLVVANNQIEDLNKLQDKYKDEIENFKKIDAIAKNEINSLKQNFIIAKKEVTAIHESTSWRLTSPIRSTVLFFKEINNLIKKINLAIKHSNGIIKLISKTFFVFQNEGIDGIRNRLSFIQISHKKKKNLDSELIKKSEAIPEILRIEFDSTSNKYIDYQKNPPISPLVKLIAFYLPQFHPFPENDEWWGKGFTEWTNVGKAQPNFTGHYQPHCPIHNGYYDLRIPEVMEEQAKLAKEYGVYGFSYYFYWFGGKILMDKPLEMMLANKYVAMPFCLTWANENWTRRWDGQENEILISQNYSDEDSLAFIRHLLKYFKDERYICIDDKPVLIIYRANLIPNIAATAKIWRNELILNGFPGLYLISAQTFGIGSPEPFDFDAAVEFHPHNSKSGNINNEVDIINLDYTGQIFSYDQVVENAIKSKEPEYKLFRSAMLSWDNTARKKNNSHIFHNFSLLRYKQWLSSLVNKVYSNPKYSNDEKLVFINAWNEWAEGTHLEPDQKFGYGYLQTTYDVICNYGAATYVDKTIKKTKRNECAVILHLYYDDIWSDICAYLSKAFEDQAFDLYVSVTSLSGFKKVHSDFPGAYIELIENRGRDILPFIRMLKLISSIEYKAVCKIHSKRSVYRNDGDEIREDILNQLIGSKIKVNKIISRFNNNSKLGMLVPNKYLVSHNDKNMTFDLSNVENISKILNIKFDFYQFPAGSMFWFSPKSLSPLLLIDDDLFEIELGLIDGTSAHAIERLFCNIVKHSNYLVESC
jgi:lipopolysaccharide biosynthesis protein/SAM-dependent methyltransferase